MTNLSLPHSTPATARRDVLDFQARRIAQSIVESYDTLQAEPWGSQRATWLARYVAELVGLAVAFGVVVEVMDLLPASMHADFERWVRSAERTVQAQAEGGAA